MEEARVFELENCLLFMTARKRPKVFRKYRQYEPNYLAPAAFHGLWHVFGHCHRCERWQFIGSSLSLSFSQKHQVAFLADAVKPNFDQLSDILCRRARNIMLNAGA